MPSGEIWIVLGTEFFAMVTIIISTGILGKICMLKLMQVL